jgi:hypothetical protein
MVSEWRCPRCGATLVAFAYPAKGAIERNANIPVGRCEACNGVAVEVRHNVPFLDALAADLAGHVDLDTPIPPHEGETTPAGCPKCAGPMARFGYLGTNRVFLDRCDRCLLLWHDGDELLVTVALHARTNRRRERRETDRAEATRALNAITGAVLRGNIRS